MLPSSNRASAILNDLASAIDHTLLKADATEAEITQLCAEAKSNGFATVCVNSQWIELAARLLSGSRTLPITVVGFPLGASLTDAKAFEARAAVEKGAREIDMVIAIGSLKAGDQAYVLSDIQAVVKASHPYPVKVILETGLLNRDQKILACQLAKKGGAAFVKTSTGFSTGGATVEDIRLMRETVGPELGVKASGGVRSFEDARLLIEAGATRIGASASVAIVSGAAATKSSAKGSAKGSEGY